MESIPPTTDNNTNSTTTTTTTNAVNNNTNTTTNNNNRDQFLRHLNKLSHKISKPNIPPSNVAGSSTFKKPSSSSSSEPPVHPPPPPQQQQQPPVYNINKSDFRDVVQKLTGSPAHATATSHQPPAQPIHAPKPASSRLQRIRPPPLSQLTSRPPPLLNPNINPLSPLPPLPTCHAAAESPISAYMRFLHNSISAVDASHYRTPQMLPPPPTTTTSTATTTLNDPGLSSFGFLPSPKSPCPINYPNLMFSPTGNGPLGFPPLPISPTVPGVSSPKWRDL
ncbi:hypothetical protein BVRB_1g008600 [Beta vulgaris subsp. vulgaris]|nr:hypothetical protein BVRB_1g008600 [Beta vulgaris subsp. vulgaris]